MNPWRREQVAGRRSVYLSGNVSTDGSPQRVPLSAPLPSLPISGAWGAASTPQSSFQESGPTWQLPEPALGPRQTQNQLDACLWLW